MWMSSAESYEPFLPRHAVHPLAAWKDILRGTPIRARQVLRKLVAGPIRMEPMSKVHEYRWKGQLNGGAVLEGAQNSLGRRGRESNPHGVAWVGDSSHDYTDRPELREAIVWPNQWQGGG